MTGRRGTSTYGFKQTGSLISRQIRSAGESRGFAVSRVLTHWAEIAGPSIARIARPVDVSYSRGGFGATLTILTTGAQAPMLEMQKEQLREKVNAAYGYNAIARIRITQTAATGFAEGQAQFAPKPPEAPRGQPTPTPAACEQATGIQDSDLRLALERLGTHVLAKPNNEKKRVT